MKSQGRRCDARIGRGKYRTAAHGSPWDHCLTEHCEDHQVSRCNVELLQHPYGSQHANAESRRRFGEWSYEEAGKEQPSAPFCRRIERAFLLGLALRRLGFHLRRMS
ncbi:hypothetical protein D3C72_1759380 [compost metagenome]